jgi:hypothetical protein
MPPRGSGGIREFLDTGTDLRWLGSAYCPGSAAAARTPPGSGTCPGTRPSPSPRAPPPCPGLGPAARALTLPAIPLVELTRLYVGAHLPLDIVGGAALGLAADAAAGPALARTARTR